jgi:mRNA-degrading endonuclease toxin of MazEF toxin-antitoxin module
MKLNRGDVAMARFPHLAGTRGKKRPVVVVQADAYSGRFPHVIVAEVTSNLANRGDPAYLHIDISTPEGQTTGLRRESLVSFLHLATIYADRADRVIGKLSGTLLARMSDCLKTSLGIS